MLFITLALLFVPTSSTSERITCRANGECIDSLEVFLDATSSYSNCLRLCKDYDNCMWITYNTKNGLCVGLFNCFEISDGCPDCVSSEVDCEALICNEKVNKQVLDKFHSSS